MNLNDSRWPAVAEAHRADHDAICPEPARPGPRFAESPRASRAVAAACLFGAVAAITAAIFQPEEGDRMDAYSTAEREARERTAAIVTKPFAGDRAALYTAGLQTQILTHVDKPEKRERFVFDSAVRAESEFGALESADSIPRGWVAKR